MARPRKPTAVLELTGAFQHNPDRGRDRANEPQPTGSLGEPPARWYGEKFDLEREVWRDLEAEVPPNVLTNSDRQAVEVYCRHMAKFRRGDDLKGHELKAILYLQGRFGMTPSDRSKISVPKPNESANAFAEFADAAELTQ